MGQIISPAIKNEICELYKEGYSVAELSNTYDIGRSSVYRIVSGLKPTKERVVDTVVKYVPSYKKEIKPTITKVTYSYDVPFSIDFIEKKYNIHDRDALSDVFYNTGDSIDNHIKKLESLIGVLMFIKSSLEGNKNEG